MAKKSPKKSPKKVQKVETPVEKKEPTDSFKLDFESYFLLLKLCFLMPNEYAKSIPTQSSYKQSLNPRGGYKNPLIFFTINFSILSLIPMLINAALTQNGALVFI